MADIKKRLILEAQIDTQSLQKSIAKLKKELGGSLNVAFGASGISKASKDLGKAKKEAESLSSEIKKFNQESKDQALGEVAKDLEKAKKETTSLTEQVRKFNEETQNQTWASVSKDVESTQREIEKLRTETSRLNEESRSEAFKEMYQDIEKARKETEKLRKEKETLEQKFGGGAFTNLETGRVVRPEPPSVKAAKAAAKIREDSAKKLEKEAIKFEQELQRQREANIRKVQREEGYAQVGPGFAGAMDDFTAQQQRRAGPGRLARAGQFARGGLAAAGAVGAAGIGVLQLQRIMAEREFRPIRDVTQGRHLEAIARQAGRERFLPRAMGVGAGAAAGAAGGAAIGGGVGALFGGIGAAPGALIGGAIGGIGGAVGGYFKGQEIGGELNVERVAPLLDAFQRARQISPMRRQALRGGALPQGGATLNAMGALGAMQGFMPEETMQQFLQARPFLGGEAAMAMPGMQRMMNITGVGVGEQARAAEIFAGAGPTGEGRMGEGVTQTVDILKKGVAAGLDISKSGQFLRTTAQYVQQNAGMARMDAGDMANRLAESVAAFARGGPATQMDIQRAQELRQQVRQESMATGGLSGVGNVIGLQRAFQEAGAEMTPGLFMAMQGASADATVEDLAEIAKRGGLPEDQANKLARSVQSNKQRNVQMGLEAAGIEATSAMAIGITRGEIGGTAEARLGRFQAQERVAGGAGLARTDEQVQKEFDAAEEGIRQSKEFGLAQKEATLANQQVTEGVDLFAVGAAKAAQTSNELADALKTTKDRLLEYAAELQINRTQQ